MEKQLKEIFKNKKILVTGGTGFIGSEIVRKLLQYEPDVVRILSNDEDSMFRIIQELGEGENKRFLIGDIRDKERLSLAMEHIDIVYHAAALKHVPLCEYNPFEAIKTNVVGTQNVIDAALKSGVEKVISISTDKAVNPVNTMGATKLLSEKLIIDANYYKGIRKTVFSCVRFGNVLFSRGSVIPLFEEQIRTKKPVTITDPDMTRFMMSISNTIDLVFKASLLAQGGEIFILKMPVVKMGDLIDVVVDVYAQKYGMITDVVERMIIGPRPGEKKYEELLTETETKKVFETDEMLIIPPQLEFPDMKYEPSDYPNAHISTYNRYNSREIKPLTKEQIKTLIVH